MCGKSSCKSIASYPFPVVHDYGRQIRDKRMLVVYPLQNIYKACLQSQSTVIASKKSVLASAAFDHQGHGGHTLKPPTTSYHSAIALRCHARSTNLADERSLILMMVVVVRVLIAIVLVPPFSATSFRLIFVAGSWWLLVAQDGVMELAQHPEQRGE